MQVFLPVVFLGILITPFSQCAENLTNDYSLGLEFLLSNETLSANNYSLEDEGSLLPTVKIETVTKRLDKEKNEDDNIEYEGTDFCGSPPVIEHTIVAEKESPPYKVGSLLSYSCEFGYSADGASHTALCVQPTPNSRSRWTDPGIVCIPRSCGDPGFVTNARRLGSRFTFPNSVSFECDDGFELRGSNIRYCQVNGRWSGALPSCQKIICNRPNDPENGKVSFSSLEFGSQLKYECDKGFILKNHRPRICSENGTWSGTEPLCLDAQCDTPIAPEHGFVETVGGIPRIGSIALYTCKTGRILIGSGTSKCLEIGEWTFPAPKCVEPCTVPVVMHGQIGKYVSQIWKRTQKRFTMLDAGNTLADGEELVLRCSEQYEPLGKNSVEEKVICKNGQWKQIPVCEPAQCRSDPPSTENGRIARKIEKHGGTVVYYCLKNFRKAKYGNITCHFGTWIGITPICTDSRCYVTKLPYSGLLKTDKDIYFSKQSFKPTCEEGYEESKSDNKLICQEGKWTGHFPPCKPASCSARPPSPQHGAIKSHSNSHTSIVSYECDDPYFLESQSQVQCSFGKWKGTPPVCKDSRCYFENLELKSGVVLPSKNPVSSGETLDVQCVSGYSPINVRPICSKGKWTEYGTSPCRESDCMIFKIDNGAITRRITQKRWTIKGRITEVLYEEEKIGTTKAPEESLYVTCNSRYSFQGKNMNDIRITCKEGRWVPTPKCLYPGDKFEELSTTSSTSKSMPIPEVITDRAKPLSASTTKEITHFVSNGATKAPVLHPIADHEDSCSCIYQGSEYLIAFVGNRRLNVGTKVKPNSVVKLYCLYFGYHRLAGSSEMVCSNCKTWHSSEYPDCVPPSRGDTIIQIDPNQKILPGGILTMDQGVVSRILCISNGVANFPEWTATVNPDSWTQFQVYDESTHPTYSSVLEILNAGPEHNGLYTCRAKDHRGNAIRIEIKVQCTKFEETEDFYVYYDNKQNINSSALFTCKDRNKKLQGPTVLICQANGHWSGDPPKCISPPCLELEEKENMVTVYSKELQVGSIATFHCFLPHIRNGPSRIVCLNNSQWSGNVPYCTLPSCSLTTLFEHIPENVVPNMENINNETLPYGFELPLMCEGNMRLLETANAKCGIKGLWVVPKAQCVSGCGSIMTSTDSQLIVEPVKDFYRFGEFVALSCAPGQVLSEDIEIIMCLRDGWSESELPSCTDL